MKIMSLQPQQKPNAKRTGKRITFFNDQGVAMKEASQHSEASAYYGIGVTPSGPGHNDSGAVESSNAEAPHMYLNSVIFSPEKGDQSRGHYQQTMPMKWAHQDPSLQPQQRPNNWSQGVTAWPQNFAPFFGAQTVFAKQMHESMSIQQQQQQKQQPEPSTIRATEKQGADMSEESFKDATKTSRSMEWEQKQNFQQTQKPGMLNPQQHGQSTTGNSVLQPFQLAFGQPKQNLVAGYYQVVQSNRTLPNLNYSTQTNSQHHLQQLQQQEQQQKLQQMRRQIMLQQQQQQQQLERQIQQQELQRQKQPRQVPSSQPAHQQKIQPPQQQVQQQHLQQIQLDLAKQQQKSEQPHQNQHVVDNYPDGQKPHASSFDQHHPPLKGQSQETTDPLSTQSQDSVSPTVSHQSIGTQPPGPRRSRRLSKEGGGPASDNPFVMPTDHHTQGSQNGASVTSVAQDIRAAPTGVIQSTRRKRRVSQEVNLETLAQKASERESLPSHSIKQEPHRPWSPPVAPSGPGRGVDEVDLVSAKRPKDESLMPLVIPVSVPVRQTDSSSPDHEQASLSASWPSQPLGSYDMSCSEYKTSVIVTRRRSLRNSLSESTGQNGGTESGSDADGKFKAKRRPRPEPLFIPPPKLGTFIAPPVYSSITPYQSHLRSPVRLVDNPLNMPPYTPPPILSPVREGSGLYFSTFLSAAAAAAAAANNQGLPPPATPKSATRSLLRSNSSDITPPVLSAMSEATPVSIEPRINIGLRYQAEVPELRECSIAQHDLHKAELVWAPLRDLEANPELLQRVDNLMHLACSSALSRGGTNQELAMHCLNECKGDIMGALSCLLLKNPIFPKTHPLSNYHYSGSDSWTADERRCFNKGIAAYKKDFFMVQKLVSSKTVAQCVEFYYTYKKQVKIGRNGTLTYGEAELLETKPTTEEEVDNKSSQKFESRKEEDESRKWDGSCDRKQENSPGRVTQSLQATENAAAILVLRSQEDSTRDSSTLGVSHAPTPPSKPRSDTTGRKSGAGSTGKGQTNQEGEFPCKKCGRIFYKVKSRSAHMKSHAEAEKKAAALRQREAEQRAAAAAMLAAQQNGAMGAGTRRASSDDSSEEEEDADDEDWH
ncbi:mitotic deacetylase-associated SANT domain protein-like [Myxocyprinus asiaticus]|uniref:mitotic deacetylase-associated SANT domain protein-like n=1 Tax=Myxocyprinus asiaticus TaxID=70543 RepID=UPI0022232927|nr:mitotic deacetylase-associated SANT domain protein-like [Myxocyprinus asiaticus]XP_051578526.1 mitotic deacetylase-associated SANT domain protein-like [Myxocyprinus asiaticus]